ncbi:hypothetical protein CRG98_043154 [Punica granatum]|uniref:Uncharacterized protein n=1 Tax=Punica granatum TaxID=22663 RepID=A0A2I0HYV6_PUNGR|nr:hypothetical protein CRG98_043154 [Punica granatum]
MSKGITWDDKGSTKGDFGSPFHHRAEERPGPLRGVTENLNKGMHCSIAPNTMIPRRLILSHTGGRSQPPSLMEVPPCNCRSHNIPPSIVLENHEESVTIAIYSLTQCWGSTPPDVQMGMVIRVSPRERGQRSDGFVRRMRELELMDGDAAKQWMEWWRVADGDCRGWLLVSDQRKQGWALTAFSLCRV